MRESASVEGMEEGEDDDVAALGRPVLQISSAERSVRLWRSLQQGAPARIAGSLVRLITGQAVPAGNGISQARSRAFAMAAYGCAKQANISSSRGRR